MDAGHAALPLPHDDGGLGHLEARQNRGQRGLRLRVVNGVVPGKIGGHPRIGRAEAAGHIQHPMPGQQENQPAQEPDADPTHKAGLEALFFDKAAADAHIAFAVQHGLHDLHQVGGVVLAVAVHLHGHIIAVAHGIQVAALHVAADAQIDRQVQERVMMPAKQLGAAVGRAIVHDEKIHLRAFRAQIFYRIDDVILLIVARDDNKNFFIQRGVPLNRIVVTSLGPLCEGDSPLRGEMSRSDRGARARRAPPAGGGGENLAVIRNISGRSKVLSLRPCGATSLPEGGREKTAE